MSGTTFSWLGGREMLCSECASEAKAENQRVTEFTDANHEEMKRIFGTYRCDWCNAAHDEKAASLA